MVMKDGVEMNRQLSEQRIKPAVPSHNREVKQITSAGCRKDTAVTRRKEAQKVRYLHSAKGGRTDRMPLLWRFCCSSNHVDVGKPVSSENWHDGGAGFEPVGWPEKCDRLRVDLTHGPRLWACPCTVLIYRYIKLFLGLGPNVRRTQEINTN